MTATAPVVYQYPKLLRHTLLRRYKRFLADVVPQTTTQSSALLPAIPSAAAGPPAGQHTPPAPPAAPASLPGTAAGTACATHVAAVGTQLPAATGSQAALPGVQIPGVTAGTEEGAVVVHCPNTGPMTGLLDRLPCPALCSVSAAKGRKYAMTLELLQPEPGVWVGVHSALANKMAAGLLRQQLLPELGEYTTIQQEVAYGANSRVDFVLTRPGGVKVYVEVKSVTLAQPLQPQLLPAGVTIRSPPWCLQLPASTPSSQQETQHCQSSQQRQQQELPAQLPPQGQQQQQLTQQGQESKQQLRMALFPDTVSPRALRHVQELTAVLGQGHQAVCLFIIQRADCAAFAPCADKDPQYALAMAAAAAAGVQMVAAVCAVSPDPWEAPPTAAAAADGAAAVAAAAGAGDAAEIPIRFYGTVPVVLDYNSGAAAAAAAAAAARPKKADGGKKPASGNSSSKQAPAKKARQAAARDS